MTGESIYPLPAAQASINLIKSGIASLRTMWGPNHSVAHIHSVWTCAVQSRTEEDWATTSPGVRVPEWPGNPMFEVCALLPVSDMAGRYESLRRGGEIIPMISMDLPDIAAMAGVRNNIYLDQFRYDKWLLADLFAYALPTPGDIAWMAGHLDRLGLGVVEACAGKGYWAWQLHQAGVDVLAYDISPPRAGNGEGDMKLFHYVAAATSAEAAAKHPDRALFLCWPPLDDPAAAEALAAYKGDYLFFCGEGWGGCVADDAFFEALSDEWECISHSPDHITWEGIHCTLELWERKEHQDR